MSLIEIFATLFGLACVWLSVKQNVWCWPVGIIQVFLYIFIFFEAQLYADVFLHIIYVFLGFYGWHLWINRKGVNEILRVSSINNSINSWLAVCLVGSLSLGFIIDYYTSAALAYPDAFITIASLIAQWLMSKKKVEAWWFWIAVDVVAINVYWIKELYLTSGLYTLFLVMAILGLIEWRKELLQSKPVTSI